MWGVLSDKRTGLSFTIAPGPRQRSHFQVRVRGARDHILLSQIQDFAFVASYDSLGYGGGIRLCFPFVSEILGFRTLSIVVVLKIKLRKNTTFRKLDLFPSSGEGKKPILLGPLERASLNHWGPTEYVFSLT
jgi:hypothetical protein